MRAAGRADLSCARGPRRPPRARHVLAFDPAGDVTGGLTHFCHHAQVTTARLAATGAFRRAVAGCGPRVTHPPTRAARLRDRAGTGRPGCPALAVTGRPRAVAG